LTTRRAIVTFMQSHSHVFETFMDDISFGAYLRNLSKRDGRICSYGSHRELFALATMMQIPIYVYCEYASKFQWSQFTPLFTIWIRFVLFHTSLFYMKIIIMIPSSPMIHFVLAICYLQLCHSMALFVVVQMKWSFLQKLFNLSNSATCTCKPVTQSPNTIVEKSIKRANSKKSEKQIKIDSDDTNDVKKTKKKTILTKIVIPHGKKISCICKDPQVSPAAKLHKQLDTLKVILSIF